MSSELSLELSPAALVIIARDPDVPVVGSARPFGPKGSTSLGVCELTHREAVVGTGTVRSVHIGLPGRFPEQPIQPAADGRPTELAEIMALRVTDGALFQSPNPILNNSMGIVHGGIAAAGLELAASAALNAGREDEPLQTSSIRVNYLRQFVSGAESRYTAEVFRRGRRSGVADAQGNHLRRRRRAHRTCHGIPLTETRRKPVNTREQGLEVLRRLLPDLPFDDRRRIADVGQSSRPGSSTRPWNVSSAGCGPAPDWTGAPEAW